MTLSLVNTVGAGAIPPEFVSSLMKNADAARLFSGKNAQVSLPVQYTAGEGQKTAVLDRKGAQLLYAALFAADGSKRDQKVSAAEWGAIKKSITDGRGGQPQYTAPERALAKLFFSAIDDRVSTKFLGFDVNIPDKTEKKIKHDMLSFFGRMGGIASGEVRAAKAAVK